MLRSDQIRSFLSDRVAVFTKTVGMSASDWPVSHFVKTSQTIDLNFASFLSVEELPLAD